VKCISRGSSSTWDPISDIGPTFGAGSLCVLRDLPIFLGGAIL